MRQENLRMPNTRSRASSRPTEDSPEATRPAPSTVLVSWETPDIAARFEEFAEASSRFSKEIVELAAQGSKGGVADHSRMNMRIAKTIFGKWSIDILACLFTRHPAGFQEIKNALGKISARVLSLKLERLERLRLIRREVLDSRPPRVQYSLTEDGLQVARLGEPVFLYLRLMQGLLSPIDSTDGGAD